MGRAIVGSARYEYLTTSRYVLGTRGQGCVAGWTRNRAGACYAVYELLRWFKRAGNLRISNGSRVRYTMLGSSIAKKERGGGNVKPRFQAIQSSVGRAL